MGMYTGLRFEAELKPFVADAMRLAKDSDDFWLTLSRVIHVPDDWLRVSRRYFIPFGSVVYMPDDWQEKDGIPIGNTWEVCCSLKNYDEEIELFLNKVLPYLISESCSAEYLYEEWSEPNIIMIFPKEFE
jgi:hypothetical protein